MTGSIRMPELDRRGFLRLTGMAGAAAAVAELVAGPERELRLSRYAVSHLGYERTLDLTAARTRLGLDPAPTSMRGAADW